MIEIKRLGAQGDVLFRRVRALPKTAVASATNGPIVVAHSETGHHHSIDATDGVTLFTEPRDPLVCYLRLEGVEHADVVHHRAWDTHDTVRLLAGKAKTPVIFEARRQREYTPAGWRRVED
jgi:hypothetical protein